MSIKLGSLDKPELSRLEEIKELIDVLIEANEKLNIKDKYQLREIIQMCKDILELFDDIMTNYLLLQNDLINKSR